MQSLSTLPESGLHAGNASLGSFNAVVQWNLEREEGVDTDRFPPTHTQCFVNVRHNIPAKGDDSFVK